MAVLVIVTVATSTYGMDADDFAAMSSCLGDPQAACAPDCAPFDFDDDLDVDLADVAAFQCAFEVPPPAGMVFVPGGTFQMGDHHDGMPWCVPVHGVRLDGFYMGRYEVTNQQYADALNWAFAQALIDDPTTSAGIVVDGVTGTEYCDTTAHDIHAGIVFNGETQMFEAASGRADHPVTRVSWFGAAIYMNWLSMQEGRTPCYDPATWAWNGRADGYRLPTEAEWEYAARGGQDDPYVRFPCGDAIEGSMANFSGSGDPFDLHMPGTTPVGYYNGAQSPAGADMANGFGLYDMAGNVWEWCFDWYDDYEPCVGVCINPHGPDHGAGRTSRGGSWGHESWYLRTALRGYNNYFDDYRNDYGGLRICLDLP